MIQTTKNKVKKEDKKEDKKEQKNKIKIKTKTRIRNKNETSIEIKNVECQTELGPYDVHFLNSIAIEWWKTRKLPVKICIVVSISILGLGCLFLYSIAC